MMAGLCVMDYGGTGTGSFTVCAIAASLAPLRGSQCRNARWYCALITSDQSCHVDV